jgi:hypothetical protein
MKLRPYKANAQIFTLTRLTLRYLLLQDLRADAYFSLLFYLPACFAFLQRGSRFGVKKKAVSNLTQPHVLMK